MTGWVWVGIIIGLVIAISAIGIPYLITHKGMRSHYDRSEAKAYVRGKRRLRRRGAGGSPTR